jgi:putative nucleotidyltransferase with HDIG domain
MSIIERYLLRAGVAAMFAVLALLAALSFVMQRRTTDLARRTELTNCIAALYQGVDHRVQEEKSVEREYRIEGSSAVAAEHDRAAARVSSLLVKVAALDPSPATARRVAAVRRLQGRYDAAAGRLFAAVDRQDAAGIQHGEHEVIDSSTACSRHPSPPRSTARPPASRSRSCSWTWTNSPRSTRPTALRPATSASQALGEAIRAAQRATDMGYRIGGDEFAVILPGPGALGAMEFAQRLRALTRDGAGGAPFTATAGIAEALGLRSRDDLVREAEIALIGAKRVHQDVAIYGPDLELPACDAVSEDEHHTRTLASALARAVDAKDSYTRSHCQTVSQLAATIAAELGFTGERLGRMRLAGLLHDVGKIGVPDAILNKPGKLTDEEYAVMKAHSVLGCDIVRAADMPLEARWVRHHHERFDGRGYPDGLAGEEIPLESRIILVADAFEAMTSDRPYRKAPGPEVAVAEVAELRRHAGTQFDPEVVAALCRVLDRGRVGERTDAPLATAA